MRTSIDLTGASRGDVRERLFERIDEIDTGETVQMVADQVPVGPLLRYQLERTVQLSWDVTRDNPEVRVAVTVRDALSADALPEVDVRVLPPQRRHEVLLDGFDGLDPEEGFVLVNDHDPKPLYHELRSTRGDTFEWDYLEDGGREWRVAIEKTEASSAPDDDIITRYDVRRIPADERHPSIHHRYGMIPDGETMEIIAPHDPQPLKREFQHRYGDAVEWRIVEERPGRVTIRITKRTDVDAAVTDASGCAGQDPHRDAADQHGHDHDEAAGTDDGAASGADEALDVDTELDVREHPPARRHELIFQAYDGLDRGEGFVLVNDHDPEPLYHQFSAKEGPEFHWQYRRKAPGEFRVVVGKLPEPREPAPDPSESGPGF